MAPNFRPGSLQEPLTGRSLQRDNVLREIRYRNQVFRYHGIGQGHRVFLHHGNTMEFFTDLLAIWQLGAVAIPVDTRLTSVEISNLAGMVKPEYSIWCGNLDQKIGAGLSLHNVTLIESSPTGSWSRAVPDDSTQKFPMFDEEALILFTSGTTGEPKGVVHTHRSLASKWIALRTHLGTHSFRRTLCLLPSHFGHGLICNALYPWLAGQDLAILPPFSAQTTTDLGDIIDRHRITFMSSVPPVWRLALKLSRPPMDGTLERVFCGSAPFSALLWRQTQDWAGTRDIRNVYGLTETASWIAGLNDGDVIPEDGLIGEAWGADLRILGSKQPSEAPDSETPSRPGESGFVWIRTPSLMKGYLDRDDLTDKAVHNEWFFTGDTGTVDERGLFFLHGRVREEINKGGTKIQPCEIDAVFENVDGVSEACSFSFKDSFYGEDVGIALVLSEKKSFVLSAAYQSAGENLAPFKIPRRWYLVDGLPRSSQGKISREDVSRICDGLQPLNIGSSEK